MLYIGMQKSITNTWKTMVWVQNRLTSCTGMWKIYMVGQCRKSCLYVVSNGKRRSLGSFRNSYKTTMMTGRQNTSMSLMLVIYPVYKRYARLTNARNLSVVCKTRKTKLSMNSKLTLKIGIFVQWTFIFQLFIIFFLLTFYEYYILGKV